MLSIWQQPGTVIAARNETANKQITIPQPPHIPWTAEKEEENKYVNKIISKGDKCYEENNTQ